MSSKSKGINAEREIIHMFWQVEGWCSHRVAGSGSNKYPSPDIIAGNSKRMLALECKTLKKGKKYLGKEDIEQLKQFCGKFGAEPWLAMKFDRQPWFFLKLKDLENTGTCFAISQNLIKKKGITFQKLIDLPENHIAEGNITSSKSKGISTPKIKITAFQNQKI